MQKQLKTKRVMHKKNASIGRDQLEANSGQPSSPTEAAISGLSQSGERAQTKKIPITAEEADRRFDEGESVFDLGFSKTGWRRPGLEPKRFNVDVPSHLLEKLDNAAQLRGVTRQALVKTWLFDRLMQEEK